MFLWFCDGRKMREIHIAEGFDEEYFDKVYVKKQCFFGKILHFRKKHDTFVR